MRILSSLKRDSYVCDTASSFREAKCFVGAFRYDCIVVDQSLKDGGALRLLNLLKSGRREDKVLIISEPDSLDARKKALNLGADDFLANPFHLSELNARVSALVRSKYLRGSPVVSHSELRVDLATSSVSFKGKSLNLTKTEFDVIRLLLFGRGQIISKGTIAAIIIGGTADPEYDSAFIYTHINNLRRKLAAAGCRGYIKTVYGVGYEFSG